MGARVIKGMNATNPTKSVLSDASVKCVGGQKFITLEQSKSFWWHDKMQKALLATDRTVAIAYLLPLCN
jgi:hypothetical protein